MFSLSICKKYEQREQSHVHTRVEAVCFDTIKYLGFKQCSSLITTGAHPVSYPVGTRGSFPGGKAAAA
jgi:hypothetical protein